MCIVNLGRESQASQGLAEMCLQRADHNKHERFGVSTKGELQKIRKLEPVSP